MPQQITGFPLTVYRSDEYPSDANIQDAHIINYYQTGTGMRKLTWANVKARLADIHYSKTEVDNLIEVTAAGSANFAAYDAGFTYLGGTTYYVSYNNKIYKFISDDNQTGETPGSDPAIWEITSNNDLTHAKNRDTKLDEGGDNEVTAANLRAHLDKWGINTIQHGVSAGSNSFSINNNQGFLTAAGAFSVRNKANTSGFAQEIVANLTTGQFTGLLFSTSNLVAKAGFAYEQTTTFGRGDFHFLIDNASDSGIVDLTKKKFTIRRGGDLVGWNYSGSGNQLAYFESDGTFKRSGITITNVEQTTNKNVANGYVGLNSTGVIDTAYLPGYVDDVLEFASTGNFPATGESGKIYIALDNNKTYRWSGSIYTEISPGDVNSVFGRTGPIIAVATDYNSYYLRHDTAAQGLSGTQQANARTNLALGTMATQSAGAVDINGGAIDGTPIGANSASSGRFSSLVFASGANRSITASDGNLITFNTNGTINYQLGASVASTSGHSFLDKSGTELAVIRDDGLSVFRNETFSRVETIATTLTSRIAASQSIENKFVTQNQSETDGSYAGYQFNVENSNGDLQIAWMAAESRANGTSAFAPKLVWGARNGGTTCEPWMELADKNLKAFGSITSVSMAAGAGETNLVYVDDTGKLVKGAKRQETIIIAVSDEVSDLTTGTAKLTFRMPYAFTLTAVRASVNTAPTGAAIQVDINEAGSTVLTTKLTIDATEKTSTTAATSAVIGGAGPALADDAEMTIDIDQVGSTITGAGLKVYLIGYRS